LNFLKASLIETDSSLYLIVQSSRQNYLKKIYFKRNVLKNQFK